MRDFSSGSDKFPRSFSSSSPEFRAYVTELVSRAYFNIHGLNLTHADAQWSSLIIAACMQLCLEDRARDLPARELVQLFQNVIRISGEHQREAKRHTAMAMNVFYLKETALDSSLYEQSFASHYRRATPTIVGLNVALSGRLGAAPAEADENV
jgi:hypothetical protein